MSVFITLDSDFRARGETGDYTATIQGGGITLPQYEKYDWHLALVNLQVFNVVPNISAALGNNTISISRDGGTVFQTLTLADGRYTFTQLQAEIELFLLGLGWFSGTSAAPVYDIQLSVDLATSTFFFKINNPPLDPGATEYVVRVDAGLNINLGFNAGQQIAGSAGIVKSPNTPNFDRGTDNQFLQLNLIDSASAYVGNAPSQTLFNYSPDRGTGRLLTYKPNVRDYVRLNTQRIDSIDVRFTGETGRVLDFLGNQTIFTIEVKPLKIPH